MSLILWRRCIVHRIWNLHFLCMEVMYILPLNKVLAHLCFWFFSDTTPYRLHPISTLDKFTSLWQWWTTRWSPLFAKSTMGSRARGFHRRRRPEGIWVCAPPGWAGLSWALLCHATSESKRKRWTETIFYIVHGCALWCLIATGVRIHSSGTSP